MDRSNKNIREQRSVRTARLKSKVDTTTKQVQQFNQTYFQIPLPPHFHTQSHNNYKSQSNHVSKTSMECYQPEEVDLRKENIKQKIKFRVKQELWNMLKKNSQKISSHKQVVEQSPPQAKIASKSVSFIAGKTFTRFSRSYCSSNKSNFSPQKKISPEKQEESLKQTVKRQRKQHRRGWSSVKMREKDRILIQKNQIRVNKSAIYPQKIQSFKIEPWKFIEQQQSQQLC